MTEKIPLINSQNSVVKIFGYAIYGFLALSILGLFVPQDSTATSDGTIADQPALDSSGNPIEYDTSSFGQLGRVEYDTPEGDVVVDLPDGFYLRHKLGMDSDGIWSISAAKTEPDCIYFDEPVCPGYSLDITWGKWDDDFDSWIDLTGGYNGTWITTASGHMAWVVSGEEGQYAALVKYSDDEHKFMRAMIIPITTNAPALSIDRQEFEKFVKSIDIRAPSALGGR
ncbi:hypothetical protein [Methanothrix sp.]|uniref:hypothetical protein n=1 Tax=Methanothrix sp. TaxID=90426 RepID=UPI003298F576